MATNLTRQDEIKAGTLDGAADKLAAMRAESQRESLTPVGTQEAIEPVEAEEIQEEAPLPTEEAPPEEVAPSEEADLFADDLDEVAETQTLEAPAALSKEGKELFSQLAPELQSEVEARIKAAERGATQKVQQVAEKEKELEQTAQEVLRLRDEWTAKLQSMDVAQPVPPDPDLADVNSEKYDPDQFNVELAKYERARLKAQSDQAERQKLANENAELSQKQLQQTRTQHAAKIVEYFPSWNTQEKFTQGVGDVQRFLSEQTGISMEAASQITDPGAIKIGYMAARYLQAKSKVRGERAPLKGSAPTGRPRTQQTAPVSKLRQTLKDSGSVDSAAALLSATRQRK